MNILLIPLIIGIILVITVIVIIPQWQDADNKTQALKIIEFRATEHSCDELKTLYLESYYKKYYSGNDLKWYWETRAKLTDQCMDSSKLKDIEFLEICKDGGSSGCEISKLENPELYKDFNFRIAVKNLQVNNGSES